RFPGEVFRHDAAVAIAIDHDVAFASDVAPVDSSRVGPRFGGPDVLRLDVLGLVLAAPVALSLFCECGRGRPRQKRSGDDHGLPMFVVHNIPRKRLSSAPAVLFFLSNLCSIGDARAGGCSGSSLIWWKRTQDARSNTTIR